MNQDDILDLDNRIRQLRQSLNVFPRYGELTGLLTMIHHPGWVNPSNYGRVSAIVDSLYGHVCAMTALQRELSSTTKLSGID